MSMRFKQGTRVFTAQDQEVGVIDRVVIDPGTNEVTHVVVRKGFLLPEDKVVPSTMIAQASEDRVTLQKDVTDLDALPPYEYTHYFPLEDDPDSGEDYPSDYAPPLYWYPPVGRIAGGFPGYAYAFPIPPYVVSTEKNIPDGAVALKEGVKVMSSDGQHVGNIAEIFTDSRTDRAIHFLIARGLL